MSETSVVIIGAGAIGRAIEHLLRLKKVNLELWDKDPTKVQNQKELAYIIPRADIIFFCVPSWVLREAIGEIEPHLRQDTIVIGLSKGIEQQARLRIDQLFTELLPKNPFTLLLGPMLAAELTQGKQGFAVAASTNGRAAEQIKELFNSSDLTLELSNDPASVALAGILKNIYAIALGISDGLEGGNNLNGWMSYVAVREMQDIAERLDLDKKAIISPAGIADFIATGFSQDSTNHRVGKELVVQGKTELKSEGLVSLPLLIASLRGDTTSLPLLRAIQDAINNPKETRRFFEPFIKS